MPVIEELPTYMGEAAEIDFGANTLGAQGIPNATDTIVAFNTIGFDNTGGAMVTTGTGARLTCVTDGLHCAFASIRWNCFTGAVGSLDTEFYMAIQVNGNNANRRGASSGAVRINRMDLSTSMCINLASGDYVQVIAYQACGAQRDVINELRTLRFSMYRLGPN